MEENTLHQPIPDRLIPELINEALNSSDPGLFVPAVSYLAKSNLKADPLLRFENSCLAIIQNKEENSEKIILFFKNMFDNLGDCSIEGIKKFIALSRKGLSDFKLLSLYLNLIPVCSENDFPQEITCESLAVLNENCNPEFIGAIVPLLRHFEENAKLFDLAVNLLETNPRGFVFSEMSVSRLNKILKHDFEKGIILYEAYLNSCPTDIYEDKEYNWINQIGALDTKGMTEEQQVRIWNINYQKLLKQFSGRLNQNSADMAVKAILKFDSKYHLKLFRQFAIQTCHDECCKTFIPYYFQNIYPLVCNLPAEFNYICDILESNNESVLTNLCTHVIIPIQKSEKERRVKFCYDWLLMNKSLFWDCSPACISQYCLTLPMDITLELFSDLYLNIGRKPNFSFMLIFLHSFLGWYKQDPHTAETKMKRLMAIIPEDAAEFRNRVDQIFKPHFKKKRKEPEYDIAYALAQHFLGETIPPAPKKTKTEQVEISQQRKDKIIFLLTQS